MWNDTWGWRQACAIVAALGVVGIVLQIACRTYSARCIRIPAKYHLGQCFFTRHSSELLITWQVQQTSTVLFFGYGSDTLVYRRTIGSVAHNGFHQADTRRNGSRTYAPVAQNRV